MMPAFRLPPALLSFPDTVQGLPARWARMSTRQRLILGGAVLGLLIALLVWKAFWGQGKQEPHAPPVYVGTVTRRNMEVQEHTIGTVVANATVQITSRVAGQLEMAAFTEGQIVRRGDVLFRLDPRPFQAALEQAIATLGRDEAQLTSARNDARRYSDLAKQGAASASQRDQAVATAKALAATVKSDHAAVDLARLNLQYSVIVAPVDGKTGPILIQPGNIIVANGTSPLVVITQVQPVKVSFYLPQADLPRIQNQYRAGKLVAALQAHGAPETRVVTPVDFIGNAVDARTGTLELRATFANTDYRFVPGQLLDVSVSLQSLANTLAVPREAVNLGPNGSFVYVVDGESVARLRNVEVLYDNGTFDAIEGNVKPGDKVITDGQLRVEPEHKVSVASRGGNAPAKKS